MKKEEKEEGREDIRHSQGGGPPPLPPFGLAEEVLEKVQPMRTEGENRSSKDKNGKMKYVTFFLGREEYGLPISDVQEINRAVEITRVPNSPDHVMGVINLRGKIVPVVELKKRLKLGATIVDKDSRIVVVEQGSKVLGLMVDRVSQVLHISSDQIEKAPEEAVQVQEDYIKGIGKFDGRMIILLELERITARKQ